MMNAYPHTYAFKTCELYWLMKRDITPNEINRIQNHPNPKMLYRAMLAQSNYSQAFLDIPDLFQRMTDPTLSPIQVLLENKVTLPAHDMTYAIATVSQHPHFEADIIFNLAIDMLKTSARPCVWAAMYSRFAKADPASANNFINITGDPLFTAALAVCMKYFEINKRIAPTAPVNVSGEWLDNIILLSKQANFLKRIAFLTRDDTLDAFNQIIEDHSNNILPPASKKRKPQQL